MTDRVKPKSEQTYDWALEQMTDPNSWCMLKDISKRLWTDELIEAAVVNLRAPLTALSMEKRTDKICRAVCEKEPEEIADVPEELRTHDFLMHVINTNPDEGYRVVKYYSRMGRKGEPYTDQDVELALESVFPKGYAERLNASFRDPRKSFESDRERMAFIAPYVKTDGLPADLVAEALMVLLEKKRAEQKDTPTIPADKV